MHELSVRDLNAHEQRQRRARAIAAVAEADLALRLLVGALILVLGAVVGASTLVQLGDFRHADAAGRPTPAAITYARADEAGRPAPCVRLADADRCVTPAELAVRFVPDRLTR